MQIIKAAGHVFEHGLFVFEAVARLFNKRGLHGLADFDAAAIGLLFAGDHLEQRGFTRAVGADDADDGASRYREAQVVDQQTVAKGFGDAVEIDDLIAQTLGHGDKDFLGFVALLMLKAGQFFEARNPCLRFGLAAFGVLPYPFQFFVQRFLAGRFG